MERERDAANVHILLAEDDALLASVVTQALVEEGHVVAHTRNVAEARQRAATEPWDLFVIDAFGDCYEEPGEPYRDMVREMSRFAPVIVTTGRAWARDRGMARDLGAMAVLCKPYDLDELLSAVAVAAERPPASEASYS